MTRNWKIKAIPEAGNGTEKICVKIAGYDATDLQARRLATLSEMADIARISSLTPARAAPNFRTPNLGGAATTKVTAAVIGAI